MASGDSAVSERRRRALCERIAALADELASEEWEDVRPNVVAYLRGLERDIRENRRRDGGANRRSYDSGPRLQRTEWIAIAHLLDWLLAAGIVPPLPLERVRELRERISGQLK